MKKITKLLAVVLVFAMVSVIVPAQNVSAKTGRVKYTLSNGVLTISGKGKMGRYKTYYEDKRIKKVIVGEGITALSNSAFEGCENLKVVKLSNTVKKIGVSCFYGTAIKKIVVPKSVKEIGDYAFCNCKSLKKVVMPGNFREFGDECAEHFITDRTVNKIKFNTELKLEVINWLGTKNFKVQKNDPNYKTIGGLLYTKNGKELLRIPGGRKNAVVAKGCNKFNIKAVTYALGEMDEGESTQLCNRLKTLTLPSSIKTIKGAKYVKDNYYGGEKFRNIKLKLNCTLTDNQLARLLREIRDLDLDYVAKQIGLVKKNNCYLSKNNAVVAYRGPNDWPVQSGKKDLVEIPEEATKICGRVFSGNYAIDKVVIGNNVKVIGRQAFEDVEADINFPEGLEIIGERAFTYNLYDYKGTVTLPSTLREIGKEAFKGVHFEELIVPETVEKIKSRAFYHEYYGDTNTCYTIDLRREDRSGYAADIINPTPETAIKYAGDIGNYKTNIDVYAYLIFWNKLENVDGYDVKYTKYYKKKAVKKSFTADSNQTSKKIRKGGRCKKIVVTIRPFKIIDEKKFYGKVSKAEL